MGDVPFRTVSSVVGISAFVLIASQFLGNVAVVQLAKPNVEGLDDDAKRLAWAVISFVSTVGGNLTITGSAGDSCNARCVPNGGMHTHLNAPCILSLIDALYMC